jgi:hypothetical protein
MGSVCCLLLGHIVIGLWAWGSYAFFKRVRMYTHTHTPQTHIEHARQRQMRNICGHFVGTYVTHVGYNGSRVDALYAIHTCHIALRICHISGYVAHVSHMWVNGACVDAHREAALCIRPGLWRWTTRAFLFRYSLSLERERAACILERERDRDRDRDRACAALTAQQPCKAVHIRFVQCSTHWMCAMQYTSDVCNAVHIRCV